MWGKYKCSNFIFITVASIFLVYHETPFLTKNCLIFPWNLGTHWQCHVVLCRYIFNEYPQHEFIRRNEII